ncbi:MAG: hypothetical protein V3R14_04940 [Nitrospinaceae bacterium]
MTAVRGQLSTRSPSGKEIMKFTHWFRRKVSAATRALTLMMPLPHGFGMKTNYESIAREGYMTNSVVFACIREIAEAAAGVPWQLFQTQSDGAQKELTIHITADAEL